MRVGNVWGSQLFGEVLLAEISKIEKQQLPHPKHEAKKIPQVNVVHRNSYSG